LTAKSAKKSRKERKEKQIALLAAIVTCGHRSACQNHLNVASRLGAGLYTEMLVLADLLSRWPLLQ
jgi:hypothetical protein